MSLVDICTVCDRKVQSFSIHLRCINCKSKHHVKCINFDRHDVVNCEPWYCPTCMKSIFVYSHYDDDNEFQSAILEGVIDSTARFHEMNSQIFPCGSILSNSTQTYVFISSIHRCDIFGFEYHRFLHYDVVHNTTMNMLYLPIPF